MCFGEMNHPSHRHPLRLQRNRPPYTCDGCNQPGFDEQYACKRCKFHLHKHCASPATTLAHPIFKDCDLWFAGLAEQRRACGCYRGCNACGDKVVGYRYYCSRKGCRVTLHPSCAKLPVQISLPTESGVKGLKHLSLRKDSPVKRLWSNSSGRKCLWCQIRKPSRGVSAWSYVSDGEEAYRLHISCAQDIFREICEEKYLGGKELAVTGGHALGAVASKLQMAAAAAEKRKKNKGEVGQKLFMTIMEILKVILPVITGAAIGDPTALFTTIFTSIAIKPNNKIQSKSTHQDPAINR